MKIRTACTCPLEIVHDIMRGKWKTIIVFQLRNGGMGLAELERGIEGITQKMLLQHLGELRAFGLIGKIEPRKGHIAVGADADILLLAPDLALHTVIARGECMMREGTLCKKGTFEE